MQPQPNLFSYTQLDQPPKRVLVARVMYAFDYAGNTIRTPHPEERGRCSSRTGYLRVIHKLGVHQDGYDPLAGVGEIACWAKQAGRWTEIDNPFM